MKIVLIVLTFFGSLPLTFSQKQVNLESVTKLETSSVAKDSTFVHSINGVSGLRVVINNRSNETFTSIDTLHRDYIETISQKMTLDHLYGLLQNDYTGSYDFMECFYVQNSTHTYCVMSFVDVFILGTNQQVFYVIMESLGDDWKYYSSYENEADKPTDNIKVVCSKTSLKLKGKYLKQIKRKGLDCLN